MELFGLLAVLLFFYLLIAPAVAWVRASNLRAESNENQRKFDLQTREIRELAKQVSALREHQLVLLQRLDKLVSGTQQDEEQAAPLQQPSAQQPAPVQQPSTRIVDALQAQTPKPPQRSASPEVRFEPSEFGIAPAQSPSTTPPVSKPSAEPAKAPPATLPITPQSWALEPLAKPEQSEIIEVSAAPVAPPPIKVAETIAVAAAPPQPRASGDARTAEAVWTPKPPRRPFDEPRPAPSDLQVQMSAFFQAAKGWLFGGNLVAKIGLMILFIGVAFLLRFASAYVVVPIEVRLAAIAAGAIALLGWGWHIRTKRPGIALPAQGAALATLMLVTFGAFKLYHLLPSGAAFALLLLLVAFTCVLAVMQDALWLAVFGIVGGFAVPILTSTGSGSHVALFSYYALLNAGILAIAWRRAWRSLNLLGFLFTFVIGTAWGAQNYSAEHYASSQFFLALFLVFYVVIAVLYAWRQAPQFKFYVDATLVFGVPTVAMGLQYGLVKDMPFGSALSALSLGLFYACTAMALWRWRQGSLRLLVESFLALAVVFGTLAIPLAFDGRWTSAVWALEGAGIVWIGLRQKQALVWRFGILVQFFSWLAFLRALTGLDPIAALANHISLGFVVLGATGVFLALTFRRHGLHDDDASGERQGFGRMANGFIAIAVLWLLAGMWVEVWLRVTGVHRASLYVLTAIALVFGLQWLGRRANWRLPDLLAGAVTAVAGLTFLALMSRYMDWRNISVYAQSSLAQVLSNSALIGGALLSAAALVSAFAFKRRVAELEAEVLDATDARRSATIWLSLAIFWWCGFALHGAAHALAWLTSAGELAEPWYHIPFWAAYSVGLALSAWGTMLLTQAYAFPNRNFVLRLLWPSLSALGTWFYLVQTSPKLMIEQMLEFDAPLALPADGVQDVLMAFAGGPVLGSVILLLLAWIGMQKISNSKRSPDLSAEQRSTGVAVWLIGLAVVLYVPLIDSLSVLSTQLLVAQGAVIGNLGWLSYADARLLWMSLAALALLPLANSRVQALRWVTLPSALQQTLATLVILGMLYAQSRLPSFGTAIAMVSTWAAMAWCLRYWHARWGVSAGGVKALHFARVIAPWVMLAPLVSLNLIPLLAAPEASSDDWVMAGMWPDYLAAWVSIGALFVGLAQVRRAGWPLRPVHLWYGATVIPCAALWALLLVIYWNLRQDGSMAPLPYLPILNPLDLTSAFVAFLLADLWRLHAADASVAQRLFAIRAAMALVFGWFNLMLLRTAAQFLGLPYRFAPLFESQFVQAMLSLVWTLCAFALMRYAARKLSKPLWMVGAALLGVVVLKLFLIDLSKVGSVARIVSFMGVGGLMLLIGYLAPLPREAENEEGSTR